MDQSFDFGELLQLHENNHNSEPVQFNSVAVGVKLSLDAQNNKRRTSRLTYLDNIRNNIPKCESLVPPKTDKKTKLDHRMEQLQLWKQEKERKKMEAALNKKKPFLVGVVHNPKISTFAPKNATLNSTLNVVKLPLHTPRTDAKKGISKEEHKHQTIKKNHTEKYAKTPEPIVEVVQKLPSPCATMARGKDNASKEINKKNDEGLLDDGVYEMDTLDHCEQQLDSEIKRTTEMGAWNKLFQLVPEAVKKTVFGAVGQARLLMSQEMHQFASLLMFTIISYFKFLF